MTDLIKFGLRGGAETSSHSDFTLESLLNYRGLSNSSDNEPCPNCGCTRLNVVRMPSHCHFAAIRCVECDTFRQWLAQPKNIEARQRRQATISQLLKSPQLSQWEQTFLESVLLKKLSPRQQEILARIETKLGGQN